GTRVGIAADDSTSSMDVWPGTDALSSVRQIDGGRERQNLAARRTAAQMEGVYRSRESGGVFALVGELSGLRWDRPVSADAELRQGAVHPEGTFILGGVIPRFFDRHL